MPAQGFLLSIAGLSVSLAGFSGLVAAFRRGGEWKPIDSYRLRQIPEMGLPIAVLTLFAIPLFDTTGSASTTLRTVASLAVAYTVFHIFALIFRARGMGLNVSAANFWAAGIIDLGALAAGAVAIAAGTAATFEWLLVLLVARPAVAFVLVLSDVPRS